MLEREYPPEVIEAGIQRARLVPRSEALKKVEKGAGGPGDVARQHRLIVEFDRRSSPALGQVLKNNYEAAAQRDARFKTLFSKCPRPCFKRGRNIKQLLVRARLPRRKPLNTRSTMRETNRGVSRCNKGSSRRQCGACTFLTKNPQDVIKSIKMNSTGETIEIMDKLNCKSKGCLYVLQSDKDPRQYGGQSGAEIGTRSLQHAYGIDVGLDKTVPRHFAATNSSRENLVVTPIMQVRSRNPWVRLHLERRLINRYNLIEEGLNECL